MIPHRYSAVDPTNILTRVTLPDTPMSASRRRICMPRWMMKRSGVFSTRSESCPAIRVSPGRQLKAVQEEIDRRD